MLDLALPNGRLAAHHVTYLGDGHVHRGVPYVATDLAVIVKKLSLMSLCGIKVVLATWQGPWATSSHLDACLMSNLCVEMGMQFALVLDPWCAKLGPNGVTIPSTQNVIAALNAPTTQAMLNSTSYVPEKFILDFNTGANLSQLAVAFPHCDFLGFRTGFSWPSIPPITNSVLRNLAAVADIAKQNANPAMKIPGLCMNFDDSGMPLPAGVQTMTGFLAAGGVRDLTQSTWGGPARILESFSGQFLAQQLAVTPATAPIVAIVTWDDYDEQSSGPLEKIVAELVGMDWSSPIPGLPRPRRIGPATQRVLAGQKVA